MKAVTLALFILAVIAALLHESGWPYVRESLWTLETLWIVFLLITNRDGTGRPVPFQLSFRLQLLKVMWWCFVSRKKIGQTLDRFRLMVVPPNLDRLYGSTPHEEELKQLHVTLPQKQYYALQYPDGSYAWESNCQGWGSTPKKPKIGDDWCFDTQHAIWALRDLRNCKLIRITE